MKKFSLKISTKIKLLVPIILMILYLSAPLFLREYFLYLLTFMSITFIIVQGLNVMLGLTGLFSFGQAGFVAFGAYLGAIVVKHVPWLPFPVVLLIVCIGSVILGVIIGFPCLRLSGFYLAMATFAFAGAIVAIINYLEPLTGGNSGMPVPYPTIGTFKLNTTLELFYIVAVIAIICQAVVINISKTKIGRAWNAIRDDEIAAYSMGINVPKYKLLSFAVGSLYGGLGGILYAYILTFIRPDFFSLVMSVNFFLILFVGGVGTILGPILGSVFITMLPQALGSAFSRYMGLFYGIILVVFVLLIPNGIVGSWNRFVLKKEPALKVKSCLKKLIPGSQKRK